ncbi:hypothetical protein CNYM01_05445 [Colletotrichum nymphaeae SA-01]|uniref:Uncharacterized protein n=1 Tax=Colletotrichum nymphaeae SA-01 TaxID=1460502 RepID=A0A135USX1_9PEZI|nr:hypothetical protein CNYM01_05445 [Colletotrichum nymphaeae SA-01]
MSRGGAVLIDVGSSREILSFGKTFLRDVSIPAAYNRRKFHVESSKRRRDSAQAKNPKEAIRKGVQSLKLEQQSLAGPSELEKLKSKQEGYWGHGRYCPATYPRSRAFAPQRPLAIDWLTRFSGRHGPVTLCYAIFVSSRSTVKS